MLSESSIFRIRGCPYGLTHHNELCVCDEAGPGRWDTWSPRGRGRSASGGGGSMCEHCSYCTLYPIPLDESSAPGAGAATGGSGGGRGHRLRETASVHRLVSEPGSGWGVGGSRPGSGSGSGLGLNELPGAGYGSRSYTDAMLMQQQRVSSMTPSHTAPFALVQHTVRPGEHIATSGSSVLLN